MTQRRDFLKKIGGASAALSLTPFFNAAFGKSLQAEIQKISGLNAVQAAKNESFWKFIQSSYSVSANITNLNNGGVSPQPIVVQDAFVRFNELSNEAPSYYMWRILDKGRETVRQNLASLADCDTEEIAINRNTTEALETIIFGLNMKSGDEVVVSNFDYPNMLNSWKQREKREGIILKYVKLDAPMEDDDEIVKRYTDQITSKTRIVHITQVINWTGQILPVKKITEAAHKRGAEVVVDGAHAFAHIEFSLKDFNCDYFGTSLHKWCCAPFGTGFLFVKKEKIPALWTMFSNDDPNSSDIRKFEVLGTRSFPSEMAIGNALKFHNMVGGKRKEERLRYLKNYWLDQVKDLEKVKSHTSQLPQYSCALTTIGIEGKSGNEINNYLFDNYKIHVTSINKEGMNGVRVTPHIYTTLPELDRLIKAITELAE